MSLFNYDNPVITIFHKITDFLLLGMLWILASIPLLTFGAATTAMYYTAHTSIHKEAGSLWSTFWSCFRREFKQATGLWLISLLVSLPLALNIFLLWKVPLNGIVFALLLATVLLGTAWMQLWYGYLSKIADSTGILLINTFRIALGSLHKLLVLVLINLTSIVAAVLSFFFAFPVLLLIPGIYVALSGIMLRKIFDPYLPKEDETETDDT